MPMLRLMADGFYENAKLLLIGPQYNDPYTSNILNRPDGGQLAYLLWRY